MPRRRPSFRDLDVGELDVVAERLADRHADLADAEPELPAAPPALEALELVWSLAAEAPRPRVAVAIARGGGFRPLLKRAGLRMR